jgi:hypothetical protein
MIGVTLSLLVVVVAGKGGPPPLADGLALARSLSSLSGERAEAVKRVIGSPEEALPYLIAWTKKPPEGKEPGNSFLKLSMIEIFGQLRTKEAIPFLVSHISCDLNVMNTVWMGGPERMASSLPAVKALLRIGPDATPELLRALANLPYCPSWTECKRKDRIAIVVTLAFLKDPRARSALEKETEHSSIEGEVAFEALKWLDKKK